MCSQISMSVVCCCFSTDDRFAAALIVGGSICVTLMLIYGAAKVSLKSDIFYCRRFFYYINQTNALHFLKFKIPESFTALGDCGLVNAKWIFWKFSESLLHTVIDLLFPVISLLQNVLYPTVLSFYYCWAFTLFPGLFYWCYTVLCHNIYW